MWRWLLCVLIAGFLGGCASTSQLTIDDGRPIPDETLAEILAFGDGQRALRPAIHRSSQLKDPGCEKVWELPFAAFSSAKLPPDQRIAWLRALGMDERLRVIATSPAAPVDLGDRIMAIGSISHSDGVDRLSDALVARRDAGQPFAMEILTNAGIRRVTVEPFQVCRGLVQLAVPAAPRLQDYHWQRAIHPLELAKVELTDDEALYLVLWTQGLSEEGGFRMKALSFGMKAVNTGFMIYQLASIANPLVAAGQVAGQVANRVMLEQARNAAIELGKQQLQAKAKELALNEAQRRLQEAAEGVAKGQGLAVMQRAAANRGVLTGISRAAATAFDEADAWAAERMPRVQADPLAAFTLHRKLVQRDYFANGLIFDPERFEAAIERAANTGYAAEAYAILERWNDPQATSAFEAMPLSSESQRGRRDDDLTDVLLRRSSDREALPRAPSMPMGSAGPVAPTAPVPGSPGPGPTTPSGAPAQPPAPPTSK